MKKIWIFTPLFAWLFISCTTTKDFSSSPQDSSRNTDPKYTQDNIAAKIDIAELDANLSRVYAAPGAPHISAIPLTGAALDSVAFLKSAKDDYNRFEYKKVSDSYRAYLFNKASCFYVFLKDKSDADLKTYDIFIGNTEGTEQKASVKSELEHDAMTRILNEIFSKTYSSGKPRSIETDSIYTQELVCGNKIDFKKPFYVRFKSKDQKVAVDLYWL